MKIDFVSLHELVQSVARDVPVEEHVLNPSLNPGKPLNVDDEFLKQAALRQIERFYKESRAAAKLGNYLAVAPRDICPRWFAPGPTGDYWATEQAREEGLGILDTIARQEHLYRDAREKNLRTRPEWRSPSLPLPVEMPTMPRSRQIGFERGELICFLDGYQVPHALGETSPVVHHQKVLVTPPLADTSRSALQVSSVGSVSTEKEIEAPNFNGPLRDVLRKAWKNAELPKDRSAIFTALIQLALATPPMRPLSEYSPDRNLRT